MKVYVIMGNDFPESVFASEEVAERYVKAKMADPANRHERSNTPRIYWRSYEFELRTDA